MNGSKRVKNYILQESIGAGNFGEVFLGQDIRTKQTVAIKVIRERKLRSNQQIQALQRETKIMQELKHDHIVKLYDYIATENNHYLILEYCSGGDLSSQKRIGEELTVIYLKQILKALKELMARKVVHRDLKPANIMLSDRTANAKIKIADFGLARQMDPETLCKTYVGTPLYMAPEILNYGDIRDIRYDERADFWSIGCIVFELLTGERAFNASSEDELKKMIRDQLKTMHFLDREEISRSCKDFLSRIFRIQPGERVDFNEMKNHPFVKGFSVPKFITDLSYVDCIRDGPIQLTETEAYEMADTFCELAGMVSHPFLFYMKACILLKPFLDFERCWRLFKNCFEEARSTKESTEWSVSSIPRLSLEMAIHLCRHDDGVPVTRYRENLSKSLILLESLKPCDNLTRLKETIRKHRNDLY
jgi:serine/threonine protein kinase